MFCKKFFCICILLLLAGFIAVQLAPAQTFDAIQSKVRTHVLKNSMKFIVLERHEAPVVSFHVYADAGSANESYGITGISHLLEHMAFKGSKIVGTTNYEEEVKVLDEMDALYEKIKREKAKIAPDKQALEKMNARFEELRKKAKTYVVTDEFVDMLMKEGDRFVNAYTSNDATQYVDGLPSNKVEFWMSMTSDRFMNPVFREFYKERDVVMEERRLGVESRPLGRFIEDFLAVAFKAHPYHHGVVGHMSDLQSITRQDVKEYFNKFYGPNNLTVAIVGDVKAPEIFEMAEQYFGRIPGGEKPGSIRTIEPEQWGERRATVEAMAQPFLILGFHRPEARHPDHHALEALANILGQGRSSRIYQSLVKEKKVSIECGAFNGFPGDKDPNLIAFYAVPARNHTSAECLSLLDEEIEKVKKEAVTEDELKKYKNMAVKRMLDRMKSNAGMAGILTYADVVLGDWSLAFTQVEKIQAVQVEDIQQVAVRYLNKTNRTIGEIVPSNNK